jgi:hypothetical protein
MSSVSSRQPSTHMGSDIPAIVHALKANLSSSLVHFC